MKNRFSVLSKICIILALLCLFFGFTAIVMGAYVPFDQEAICVVGWSGMSPSLEIRLVQEGVYTPNPTILAHIGKPFGSNVNISYTDNDWDDWLW